MPDASLSKTLCKDTCDLDSCKDCDESGGDCAEKDDIVCKADLTEVELRRQDSLVMKLGQRVQAMLADMLETP